jgi:gamma-glutamylaminecyclotransferase
MTTIFVYGTLKRGGSNHRFLDGQQYLGNAQTIPGFTLYSVGDYPGMVRSAQDRAGVIGELWAIDQDCLEKLDRLEGLDEGLYERVEVGLSPNAVADRAQTYLYLRPHAGLPPLGSHWPVGPAT